MIRYIIIGIAILAIIPIAWLAWWLGSPLITSTEVNEEFPYAARAVIPSGMTMAEAESVMQEAAAVVSEVAEAMPSMRRSPGEPAEPVAELTGNFRDADAFHKGSGTATVYTLDDGVRVLRLEDFNVTNGPDLRVLLANVPDPGDRDELTAGGYVELDKLKGNVGSQNYPIPETVDLAEVRSVVIYCRPFNVVFAVATLDQP